MQFAGQTNDVKLILPYTTIGSAPTPKKKPPKFGGFLFHELRLTRTELDP